MRFTCCLCISIHSVAKNVLGIMKPALTGEKSLSQYDPANHNPDRRLHVLCEALINESISECEFIFSCACYQVFPGVYVFIKHELK